MRKWSHGVGIIAALAMVGALFTGPAALAGETDATGDADKAEPVAAMATFDVSGTADGDDTASDGGTDVASVGDGDGTFAPDGETTSDVDASRSGDVTSGDAVTSDGETTQGGATASDADAPESGDGPASSGDEPADRSAPNADEPSGDAAVNGGEANTLADDAAAQSGDFAVTGGEPGEDKDWHYESEGDHGVLKIHPHSEARITIGMAGKPSHASAADPDATKDRVEVSVPDDVNGNVVLAGVRIDLSGDTNIEVAAFAHKSGRLNLTLAKNSDNSLVSGMRHAGLEKNDIDGQAREEFALTIDSEGSDENEWGSLLAQSYNTDTEAWTSGAGIGGGDRGSASYITVMGGRVTAQSYATQSYTFGAGIGGGNRGSASYIKVSGGMVTAESRGKKYSFGAGIGSGAYGSASHITVSDGTVMAQSYADESSYGVGIGVGNSYGSASHITISGGTVTAQAYGQYSYGAGIGGGRYSSGVNDIVISGGAINARSYGWRTTFSSTAIGVGSNGGTSSNVMITGGRFAEGSPLDAVGNNRVYGITPPAGYGVVRNTGDNKDTYTVTVVKIESDFAVTGGEEGVDWHVSTSGSGFALVLHPQSADKTLRVSMAGRPAHPSSADSEATLDRIEVVPVEGVAANVVLDGVRINLSKDNVNAAAFAHKSGILNLTLGKGSVNELVSGENYAGLEKNDIDGLASYDFALTIDSEGSGEDEWGSLTAQAYYEGNVYGAGIGGRRDNSTSYITVKGGKVTARSYSERGNATGAGIGSGWGAWMPSSHITIEGGVVVAQSYSVRANAEGAGIGGGFDGSASDITITGGTVTAESYGESGSTHGAGIGGGWAGSGTKITITGGVVTARSYNEQGYVNGAGIGGGQERSASHITIAGGTVTAMSYSDGDAAYGAGLGGGRYRDGSDVVIAGGSVKVVDGNGDGAARTPQPTDGQGHAVYMVTVGGTAEGADGVRSAAWCRADGACASDGDWNRSEIAGTHVNADGSKDVNLYLWLPVDTAGDGGVASGAANDKYVRVSQKADGKDHTSYRALWQGRNADGATNDWEWYGSTDQSTYTVTIPSTPVTLQADASVTSGDFKVTGMVPVSPDALVTLSGTATSNGMATPWQDGKLTLNSGLGSGAAIRTSVTKDGGAAVSARGAVVSVHEGEGIGRLTFSAPERADGSGLPIQPGSYRATLTFLASAS